MKKEFANFVDFVKEQGVVGLAVAFVVGGAIVKIITALVTDIINPIIGLFMGGVGDLNLRYLEVGKAKILWGSFVGDLIEFLIIAACVYYGVKLLGLEKNNKKR